MKNIKTIFLPFAFLTTVLFSLLYLGSCDDGPTEPEIEPGRRDYTWTEDTLDLLSTEYLTFKDIVGSSPQDVWLGTLDASKGCGLWHYDSTWKRFDFPGYAATAIWLFEDNTLFAGTKANQIYKMENNVWTETYNLSLEGYDDILIFGFYAFSKTDIYAVGWATTEDYQYKGIILHFDGNSWEFIKISDIIDGGFHKIVYQKDINTFFIHGTIDNGNLDVLYKFDGKEISELMSTYYEIGISELNGIIYFNSQKKVYKYINNSLQLWKDFNGTPFRTAFVGRSETDFFNRADGGIGHYNGKDFTVVYKTNLTIYTKIIFEDEIFVAAEDYDNRKHIIIHGKLK